MIELLKDKEKNERAKVRLEKWNTIPEIYELIKDEPEQSKLDCVTLLDNQTAYFASVGDEYTNNILGKHNFKSTDDCLKNVVKFYKRFSIMKNVELIPLESNQKYIPYKNDLEKHEFEVSCKPMSSERLNSLLDSGKKVILGVRIPFFINDLKNRNEPCMFADHFLCNPKI